MVGMSSGSRWVRGQFKPTTERGAAKWRAARTEQQQVQQSVAPPCQGGKLNKAAIAAPARCRPPSRGPWRRLVVFGRRRRSGRGHLTAIEAGHDDGRSADGDYRAIRGDEQWEPLGTRTQQVTTERMAPNSASACPQPSRAHDTQCGRTDEADAEEKQQHQWEANTAPAGITTMPATMWR